MKQTAKLLRLRGNELQTVEGVQAALVTICEDIKSGDATVDEAEPIKKDLERRMKGIRAQMKKRKA